ncbi:MAG: tetratricopeptide repeat protein [bacterium]|nr:tetratricopeptide repeat protein [bacterium]
MARSFYPASTDNVIEDFENNHYYHAPSGQHFEMRLKEDGIYQVRYQLDDQGQRRRELEVRADYVIGSGNHIRSYVYRTPAGEMFQMPLAWYSQTREWAMNPGYDIPNHLGFDRKITRECMFCHNAYPLDIPAGSDDYWQPHVFPNNLPHGIGCQRCHGPGAEHIRLAESPTASQEQILKAIVNPENLSPQLSEDVCNQCHLQPSTQVLTQLVRAERSEYSYRPGQSLAGYRALLDYVDGSEERFEINHHAYRMRQSRCYTQSQGEMSCVSCHDPHHKVADDQRLQHYRDACMQCHSLEQCSVASESVVESAVDQTQAEASDGEKTERDKTHAGQSSDVQVDCVACHMPTRRTHDVIHATMTDHKIVTHVEPQSERLAPRQEPPPASADTQIFDYWPQRHATEEAGEVELYRAIAGSQLGNRSALQALGSYVQSQPNAALMPRAELSSALEKFGAFETQNKILFEAAKAFPEHPQANLELAMALAASGFPEEAMLYYQRSIDAGPELPEAWVGLGMSELNRGNLPAATEHFREALRLRPLYADALLNLGIVLYAQQQWDEAREKLLLAKAVDWNMTEADAYLDAMPAP